MGLVNYFLPMECDKDIGGVSGYMGLYFDDKARKDKEFEQEICKGRNRYE
jgi:hypothetical protein